MSCKLATLIQARKIVNFFPTKVLACRHLPQIHIGVYIVKFCSVHGILGVWILATYIFNVKRLFLFGKLQVPLHIQFKRLYNRKLISKCHMYLIAISVFTSSYRCSVSTFLLGRYIYVGMDLLIGSRSSPWLTYVTLKKVGASNFSL